MRAPARRGFTLIELMISMLLLSVVLGAVVSVVLGMQRSYIRQRQVAGSDDALRAAESTLLTVLRSAGANPKGTISSGANPQLSVNPLSHATFDNVRTVADFNPADGDTNDPLEDVTVSVANDTMYVRWQAGGATSPVAYGIRSLLFEYFASNGVALTTATQAGMATRVKITMDAVSHTRPVTLTRREQLWLYLRNRR
jgi:prepilin-type N-terminal cleavage/methylation domain-containing protein